MKYFLFCDFSTVSCERKTIAEILEKNEIEFINHNNFLWELEVPSTFGDPFCDTVADAIYCLFLNYIDRHSHLLVVKADEYSPNED